MKKFFSLIMALLVLFGAFAGCANDNSPDAIRVFALKGPTGMGMSKMMADEQAKDKSAYQFTIAGSPDEVAAEIIKGNYDIAAVPTNLAAVLYAKTQGELMIAAVNTLGVLYILENGNSIQSIGDLQGKTIYATGQASTPEYVLNYILESNGIDCEVIYLTEHSELATQMTADAVSIGMLPVPNATTVLSANTNVRIALNLTEEWEKAAALKGDDGALFQGCIVIRRDFAEQYPKAVEAFLSNYKESVNFVNNNPDEASVLIEKVGIVPKAAVALKAIPDANIVCITGSDMKNGLSGFFEVLYKFNPSSVGGAVPSDEIYYQK